jgi:hypothetical protein
MLLDSLLSQLENTQLIPDNLDEKNRDTENQASAAIGAKKT